MFAKGRAVYVGIYSALVLSLVHQTEEVQDLMSNLSCYTDYMTKIDCQWTENPRAKRYIPMDLYYQREYSTSPPRHDLCARTESTKPTSSNRCIIKEDAFGVSMKCFLIFEPKKPINLRKSFKLLDNIKLQAPFNPTVSVTEAGDYELSWETRYMGNSSDVLLGTLQYEVNYKQSWQSWEDSLSETLANGSRHLEIPGSGLVPAGTYAARVRARPQHCSSRCIWSAWSAEVTWSVNRSQPNSQAAETEVMPRNLQCFYDGLQEIECTWEVTRTSSDLFTFNLHYGKANSSETQVCNSFAILRQYPDFTVHGCNIHVRDRAEFKEYEVSFQLVKPSMQFHPYKNIEPNPPYSLSMEKLPDGRLQLHWKSNKTTYNLEYQASYVKVDRPWEENKTNNIPPGNTKFNLPKDSWDSSSKYRIRMRAKVTCSNDIYSYCGIWSEWSQSVNFVTDPGASPNYKESLIIVACSLLIFLIIFTPIAALVIKRKKKMWLDGIPDPAKSQLFHKGGQKTALRSATTLEAASMEEGSICQVVTANSLATPPQIIPREQSKYQMKEDTQGHSSPPVSGEGDQPERIYQGFKHEPGEEHANRTSPIEPSDYNGPYLFNFQDVSSLLSEFSEPKTTAGECANRARRGPEPPGYVKLPPTASGGVGGADEFPPAPCPPVPAAYILIPPAPASNIPATTQEEPSFPSLYVRSLPPTNATSNPSSQVVPDCKAIDISLSSQQGPYVVGQQSAPPTHGVDPLSGGKDATAEHGRTSPGNISPDHPMVAPWPATSGGYVSTPPAEQMALISPSTPTHQDTRLPADPQQAERSQPPTSKTDAHQAPSTLSSTKPQVDLQKPVAKEAEPPCMDTANNEASELILFQSGANPILFRQIGDYCFLPGSLPTKGTESTKGHVSSTKSEPAKKSLDSLEKQPPLQHSPSPSHHIVCS